MAPCCHWVCGAPGNLIIGCFSIQPETGYAGVVKKWGPPFWQLALGSAVSESLRIGEIGIVEETLLY
ncbi:hypothetical protein DSCO28_28260 [Desulfosarcina ovata subsp. sediminis]|uniref:Uncharacterized protein n=1 Tax=Desulfosarcina ovata subsp. sediminis TaxID=885957 RepID=A0A5K7ZQT6_9BACT|nr:hypothetical protein DSCO28_28260 [Desulfosarcina ovata subsp. sediminis]